MLTWDDSSTSKEEKKGQEENRIDYIALNDGVYFVGVINFDVRQRVKLEYGLN